MPPLSRRVITACMDTSSSSCLRAVVFDWAGTTIDFGCRAPAAVFQAVFAERGVPISEAEARAPMGLPKWRHIQSIGAAPDVAARWRQTKGRDFTDDDVDRLYGLFLPRQIEIVADYSDLIPGTLDTMAALRARDLKIGSTTGYSRDIMAVCAERARQQGYAPDAMACADDLPEGRPGPYLLWQVLTMMRVYPAQAVVKVGDTPADMAEGLNAGCWTVGLTASGNEVGLSREALDALPAQKRDARLAVARDRLREAGAHYVIDTIAALPPIIDDIDTRLARGERP